MRFRYPLRNLLPNILWNFFYKRKPLPRTGGGFGMFEKTKSL